MDGKPLVTLATLGGGALEEMFAEAVVSVAKNIDDPNTEAEAVREINIKIKIKPTKTREAVVYEVSCDPKLSRQRTATGFLFVSGKSDEHGLYDNDTKQLELIEVAKIGRNNI